MTGQRPLTELQTFEHREGSVDHGKQIRDKAYLVADLMHNRHKLEQEREQAQEYRKKFYSNMQGGFSGAGGGSFSNAGEGHGYGVPSYSQSSYNPNNASGAPSMGGGQQPADAGDGVSRVYSPYNPADDPVLKTPTAGGIKWGAGGATQSAASSAPLGTSAGASGIGSSQPAGSTYNITNNNNINYNYGSNITAISSDGGGPVPTFHDVDKAKKAAEKKAGTLSYASGALGYLGSSVGAIGNAASGLGSSTSKGLGVSSGLG